MQIVNFQMKCFLCTDLSDGNLYIHVTLFVIIEGHALMPPFSLHSLMQQLGQDHDQEDVRLYRQQSSPPVPNSPPGQYRNYRNTP
jgi:hypothetical protein